MLRVETTPFLGTDLTFWLSWVIILNLLMLIKVPNVLPGTITNFSFENTFPVIKSVTISLIFYKLWKRENIYFPSIFRPSTSFCWSMKEWQGHGKVRRARSAPQARRNLSGELSSHRNIHNAWHKLKLTWKLQPSSSNPQNMQNLRTQVKHVDSILSINKRKPFQVPPHSRWRYARKTGKRYF